MYGYGGVVHSLKLQAEKYNINYQAKPFAYRALLTLIQTLAETVTQYSCIETVKPNKKDRAPHSAYSIMLFT